MCTPGPHELVIPVFAGHGASRTSLARAADQAIIDANSPNGSLLLSSCLDALLAELASLSPDDLDQCGISPSDFDRPLCLLMPDPKYRKNHIVSGMFLFLAQVLRYQSYAHSTSRSMLGLLKSNIHYRAGVLGLSSGIFPACAVAASHNPISYITTAIEIFRSVFWISLRVLQSTRKLFKESPIDPALPWSISCLGLSKTDVKHHIARFEQNHCRSPSLRVTAVLDEKNVTVSGRPDLLVEFSTFMSRHCTVHPTTVDALYHSDLHFPHTRNRILADICSRKIRFPDYGDLCCPLRSTVSGDIVKPSVDYPSLLELIVDMVLIYPVNWDLVTKKVAYLVSAGARLRAVNIGPGSSALRALERAVPAHVLVCIDAYLDVSGETVPVRANQEPIAIIGMTAHTPGAANTAQLWQLLERGVNTVSKIPDDRFQLNADGLCHFETRVEMGNFIYDVAEFDHRFFKISPREARSMDPQQRILLHAAYEALESAGYVPDASPCFRRARFGCYIGAATQDYAENLADNVGVHYATGTLRAFLSGRISYAMQWQGPSIVVDTACSSSIVAIHQACRALMNKDCDAALAGGVNVMTSLNMFVGLERGHFLSPSGQCKSFDASADGYSRGEGCCLFVLKRLSDAIVEKDNIMGIIRGVEVNQSGLASSITHPHSPTQTDLLKSLLKRSGIAPTCVSVVEAHGTGTEAGDSCELASIRAVLSHGRTRDNPVHVTSIKANIGHLEAASGAIGLCKLLLMLRHNLIPAQISLKTLHPLIAPLDVDNTVIDTLPATWVPTSAPRRAILNNFGAAGSNGALVLEEYVKPERLPPTSPFVFGISAKSANALENLRSQYMEWLTNVRNDNVPLCDVAYTATARRQLYSFRLAVTAGDKEGLLRALETASISHVARYGGRAIFVFSGQGSQYPNMGTSLYATSAVFRSCIDRCDRFLLSLGYPGILPVVSSEHCDRVLDADGEFEAYQCAVLAVEYGLASLWKQWGVIPAGVIGHSLGEYAAMVMADVLTIETALSIVAKRARLMSRACALGETGMVFVALSSPRVQEILTTCTSFPKVTVACVNTESSCVVSGPVEELWAFRTHLTTTVGCKVVTLSMQLGFHSSAMDPILEDLRDHVATLPIHAPAIPIASNVYGTVIPVGDGLTFQADYLVRHCRQPVLFEQGLRELEQHVDPAQIGTWIDVGPHAICLPMMEAMLSRSRDVPCVATMLKGTPAWDTLTSSLARLYRTGVTLDWRRVFDELGSCFCVDLPTYPFEKQKFWVPLSQRAVFGAESTCQRTLPDHPMLASWCQYPSRENGNAAIFETPIGSLARYIEGHKVGGHALCPASMYLEQAVAGAIITQSHLELDFGKSMPILRTVVFSRPLVLGPEVHLIVRTHVTVHEDGTGSFSITSRLASSHEELVHVYGDLRFSSIRETKTNLALELHDSALPLQKGTPELFSMHTAYEVVFPRVVEYAEDYRTIRSLEVYDDGASSVAYVSLTSPLGAHPVFLDTLLHFAGFVINMQGDVADAYICSDVGLLKVVRDLVDNAQQYIIYCLRDRLSSRDFVSADVWAVQACNPVVVVALLRGVQFRRVRLTSLYRGLAMAANRGSTIRARTNSNSIVTPSSPRSIIFSRSRSNTRSATLCSPGQALDTLDVGEEEASQESDLSSPQTLVPEGSNGVDGAQVRKIMSEVLGIEDGELEDNADLGALGLDSLGSIEAQQALRVMLNRPLPHNVFIAYPTLSALCDFLANDFGAVEVGAEGTHNSEVVFVPIQRYADEGGAQVPLYLVHDGSGLVNGYERLMPLGRDVWGIGNPRLFGGEPWKSVEEIARAYAHAVEEHADGPMLLGGKYSFDMVACDPDAFAFTGWSFGGIIAFSMACILEARGVDVKGVVLIDSSAPTEPALLSDALIEHLCRGVDASMRMLVTSQFRQCAALLDAHAQRNAISVPVSVPVALLRCMQGFCLEAEGQDESAAWFCQRGDEGVDVAGPWEVLVGERIRTWDIPGHHFEPFSCERVGETSEQLDRACRYLTAY